MYGIVLSVTACLRAGTRVDVAWVVETRGLDAGDRADALAITPGGGRVGSLLSGALDAQLADVAGWDRGGRLVDLRIDTVDALIAGLPAGGEARCLIVPATGLPAELWELLDEREPVCLVTQVDGGEVASVELFTAETISAAPEPEARLFAGRVSDTLVLDDRVVTVLWPVPALVIFGTGRVVDALRAGASLLGWHPQTLDEVGAATGVVAGLAPLDKLVVVGHDPELAGRVVAAALASSVGYIGVLGSRRIQQSIADWLAYRGITDLERVHGPAGLDIGAGTPAEIALSILAEAVAVSSGSTVSGERDQAASGQR